MQAFVSDTLASSADQTYFKSDNTAHFCRIYYKVFAGGDEYRFMFGNTVDSTLADGSYSVANMLCGEWQISDARVGVVARCGMENPAEPEKFTDILFEGASYKNILPGESFFTDTVKIKAQKGEYLCVEYSFKGKKLPCHEEIIIPTFVLKDGDWVRTPKIPVPLTVQVKRDVKKRICFLGDSITQGIGATHNSYSWWCAVAAENLGREYSFYDLGIGSARASDAASDSVWLERAKNQDICVICLGTNDLLHGRSASDICRDLTRVVGILEERGISVIVQTAPPFEYPPSAAENCKKVNEYIKNTFFRCFDNTLFLCEGGDVASPVYGGHPHDGGCAVWGENIALHIKEYLA
ncbi:MAG: SGNH/GDSL hydrolase family protein [Clostridia bacterium]|nr:SGNH/GDSL hydrolase family protein [Clostridia bacterium]